METKISKMVRRMAEKESFRHARLNSKFSSSRAAIHQSLHARGNLRFPSSQAEKAKSKRGPKKKMKGEPWSLYILECGDGSLYTGVTNDLTRRFEMHSRGKGSKYTRSHLPVDLVYSEICGTRVDALVREIKIKKLPRGKKEILIKSFEINKF